MACWVAGFLRTYSVAAQRGLKRPSGSQSQRSEASSRSMAPELVPDPSARTVSRSGAAGLVPDPWPRAGSRSTAPRLVPDPRGGAVPDLRRCSSRSLGRVGSRSPALFQFPIRGVGSVPDPWGAPVPEAREQGQFPIRGSVRFPIRGGSVPDPWGGSVPDPRRWFPIRVVGSRSVGATSSRSAL